MTITIVLIIATMITNIITNMVVMLTRVLRRRQAAGSWAMQLQGSEACQALY